MSVLIGYDPTCSVLNMELLQFYYSAKFTGARQSQQETHWVSNGAT